MTHRLFSLTISFAIIGIFALHAPADILNGGFEAGSGSDPSDWAEIVGGPNGTVGRSTSMPFSGDFSGYIEFDNTGNPAGGAYFIEQIQPVGSIDPTLDYNFSFWAKTDSLDFTGVDMFYQLLWLDQDGSNGGGVQGEILNSLVVGGINTGYQQFSLTGIDIPDGADSFLARFQVSAGAVDNVANGLYVDDVRLATAIPEPTSASLLLACGLGLLVRRKRG